MVVIRRKNLFNWPLVCLVFGLFFGNPQPASGQRPDRESCAAQGARVGQEAGIAEARSFLLETGWKLGASATLSARYPELRERSVVEAYLKAALSVKNKLVRADIFYDSSTDHWVFAGLHLRDKFTGAWTEEQRRHLATVNWARSTYVNLEDLPARSRWDLFFSLTREESNELWFRTRFENGSFTPEIRYVPYELLWELVNLAIIESGDIPATDEDEYLVRVYAFIDEYPELFGPAHLRRTRSRKEIPLFAFMSLLWGLQGNAARLAPDESSERYVLEGRERFEAQLTVSPPPEGEIGITVERFVREALTRRRWP